jgi:hypothetical protein
MGTVILILFALLALSSVNGCESLNSDGDFDWGVSDEATASDGTATSDGTSTSDGLPTCDGGLRHVGGARFRGRGRRLAGRADALQSRGGGD